MSTDRGLLDTSVFVATESGRPLDIDALPTESAISVVTVAELRVGVLAALDAATRARRLTTLDSTRDIAVLPVDDAVAAEWARLRIHLAGVGRRLNVNDLWIAATASAHGIAVVSQDADFAALEGADGFRHIRV